MLKVTLKELTTEGKAIFLAYDQGLELGPDDIGETAIDPAFVLQIAVKGDYNGVILQRGIAEKYYPAKRQKVPLIIKLNGKTELVAGDPLSTQVCSVKEAIRLGAKAVGYTVYPGSKHESIMFAEFGKIVGEAHNLGLPALLWSYPRGENVKKENSPDNVAYAARIGLELGADIVKIKYPGSEEAIAKAVKAAGKTKVMMAGGPKTAESHFLKAVENAIRGGAIGVVVGRNVWQSPEPLETTKKIKKIIFSKNP